ncbi:hypothetical protein HFO56_23520 [Rhizobium laguerreae]|uniref:hypothetical protein n=1 Tax=Rhizobium laguerreae TaxID=1076926 RepID=UPI001C8FC53F|nr:hypothetical protein [Rhizobium laguerreae]MBY3155296.1 hypothetical protein [Rhizobium laguerreae]
MTDIQTEDAWRTPQIVRDRMAVRDGHPERIVALGRDVCLALLIYKLHNELYEIEAEPSSAEEVADFLTALQAVYDIVSPAWSSADAGFNRHDTSVMPLPAFIVSMAMTSDDVRISGYGAIHGLIQGFARNLLDRAAYARFVKQVSLCAKASGVDPQGVVERYMDKNKRHGGFDAHILRIDTRFPG